MEKAVAVHYSEELPAPVIVARGKGELARRIRRIAEQHGVHLLVRPELANALVELEVGSLIPEEFYRIIAEILVFVRSVSET
jgi:type III secretion system FlhB-like substrate exporter